MQKGPCPRTWAQTSGARARTVILAENFGFVERVVQPIVDTLQRMDGAKTWRICSASWAAGLARGSMGRDVVDVGSSICLRVRCDGDSVVQVAVAPSVTIPLAAA